MDLAGREGWFTRWQALVHGDDQPQDEAPLDRTGAAFHADVLVRIKLGRLGRVEDLMGAVVYLASDATELVTGASLLVDGGWTAE